MSPLPALSSPQIEDLRSNERSYRRSAYNKILGAERHGVQRQAKEDAVSARVAGYLFLEFHAQSGRVFGDGPYESTVRQVT